MIHLPSTLSELTKIDTDGSVMRAGGTDLQERLRSANAQPTIVDLSGVGELSQISQASEGWQVGAGATIAAVAEQTAATYPALALTAGGLATPQVRARATIGGNLTQHTRCWYYRHPEISCFKSGGDSCPAREGEHLYGVAFGETECVHPHPSSIAMALLTYGANVALADGSSLSIDELLGDGSDPTRDHQLPDGGIITAIQLPPVWEDERAAYFRSISRFEAEWPLVECVVRARFDGSRVAECCAAIGGVATVPLLIDGAEAILTGTDLTDEVIEQVSSACAEGTRPLRDTGYKVDLIVATVQEALERLRESAR